MQPPLSKIKIILLDADEKNTRFLSALLTNHGYAVETADGFSGVHDILDEKEADLVIAPGSFYDQKIKNARMPILYHTDPGDPVQATDNGNEGIVEFISMPLGEKEVLRAVKTSLRQQQLLNENRYLRKRLKGGEYFHNILWRSKKMRDVLDVLSQVSDTHAPVLITGERGTGKEMMAHMIHRNSPRYDRCLVKINCSALPDTLLEYELFGYEQSAFKGPKDIKTGRLELADRGTLFLDEISELSPALQVKLLKVLQESALEKTGGKETVPIDVRIIASSHKDLWACIRNNTFRHDLFYRLNVIPIHLPPLRKRKEDIPGLAEYYLRMLCEEQKKEAMVLSPEALEVLVFHDWPGNIRELINFIERLVVLHEGGIIEKHHLPSSMVQNMRNKLLEHTNASPGETLEHAVASFEKDLILKALRETRGVKAKAARQLGLSRSNLQYKIKKYGI